MSYPLTQYAKWQTLIGTAKLGLQIQCPNCKDHRYVWFKNPIGQEAPQNFIRVTHTRTGEELDNLSLTPAVAWGDHPHVWVRDGRLCFDAAFQCRSVA